MINGENVDAFINYNYIPFSKTQAIKRIIMIWISSIALCFLGKGFMLWVIPTGIVSLAMSVFFVVLITKHDLSKTSRYMCDGVFYLYMSIILNLASYRVMTLKIGANWLLLIILLLLLLACILLFMIVTLLNIKAGKFAQKNASKKVVSLPFICGLCGILVAKFVLQEQTQEATLQMLAILLLILSFVVSIPSVNLLRTVMYMRYTKL